MPFSSKSLQRLLFLFLFILAMGVNWLGHGMYPSNAVEQDRQPYQTVTCDRFQQPYWNLQWSHNIFQYHAPEAQEQQDYECGFLTVPEHHDQPDGNQIQLAVAIIKSTADTPEPDPLVLLQGGPGGSGITYFSSLANRQTIGSAALRADRDLIILEQRGTFFSQPQLRCPEVVEDISKLQFQHPNLSDADIRRYQQQSLKKCRQRLVRDGVDLTAYNSRENAADIAMLAQVLGYPKINLYGVSYGSLLALQTIRNHAQIVKSAIIDGVLPPEIHFPPTVSISNNQAISKLTNACAEDLECNRAYPHLLERFKNQIDRLNQTPIFTSIYDYRDSKFKTIQFSGDALESMIIAALYSKEFLSAIPATIDLIEHNRFEATNYLMSTELLDRTLAYGMYYSAICAEATDFSSPNLSWLDAKTSKRNIRDLKLFQTDCYNWHVPALPQIFKEPVVSDLPVLIFNGQFDPITPPTFGDTVSQTLPNSRTVTFPVGAHGALVGDRCASNIAATFLKHPLSQPDLGCLQAKTKITFITPKTTFKSPEALPIFEFMVYRQVREINFMIILTLIMLSPIIIWASRQFMPSIQQKQVQNKSPSKLAAIFAVLTGILTAIWLGLQIHGISNTIFVQPKFSILESLIGIDRDYAWINIFPLLIMINSFSTSFYTVRAWQQQKWHMLWRIYYTAIALATIFYSTLISAEILSNLVAIL
jgi:pimeloyl-ACP methyl ester carboxylesterase